MKFKWAVNGGLATLAASLMCASASAADFEWKFFTHYSPQDPPALLDKEFAKDLEQATSGRLKITVYAGGELPYKAADALRILRTKQVEMAQVAVGAVAGDLPAINVFSQPFVCSSVDIFYDKVLPEIGPEISQLMMEKFAARPLLNFSMPPQQFWLNREIHELKDFHGLKIRAWNREQTQLMKLLGGSGVTIDAAEVIPALQRKVVDGAITAAIPALSWKFYEVTKYGYMADISLSHELIAVSADALGKLPKDLQEIVLKKGSEWQAKYRAGIEAANKEAEDKLTSHGMTLTRPSAQQAKALHALAQPIVTAWAQNNGAVAQKMLVDVNKACQ